MKKPRMKKWLRILLVLLLALLAGATLLYRAMRAEGFFRAPSYETERPTLPSLARPALLLFSKTNGYIHRDAIPAAQEAFRQIAAQRGWSLYLTDSSAIYNAEDLAKFDAVIWNNVTGDVLSTEQRAALQNYIENGGGFVGVHGAGGDREYAWPWYPQTLLKAQFIGHPMNPQFQRATLHIEHSDDPIVQALDATWSFDDEWYSFEQSPRAAGVRVLATVDENSYKPEVFGFSLRMGADHPVIWKHCVEAGRVFYSALGHTAAAYDDVKYRSVLEHAVAWSAGIEGEPCVR
jgi:type 1 glutamine amidotransferase